MCMRMRFRKALSIVIPLSALIIVTASSLLAAPASGPLRVCATVTDLGSLVREIGGNQVAVTVFSKGTENPHFVEARPSFIKALSTADLYVQIGMELEAAWAPVLLQNARNGRILPGNSGYLDASVAITPLEVPTGTVDRSMGDVHPEGNPHYLLDPLNGLRVAREIRDRLTLLRPEHKKYFDQQYASFERKTATALMGERLAGRYDLSKIADLFQRGRLETYLRERNEAQLLEGWLGAMLPFHGTRVVADHNMWPYFARRFGITVRGFMEPKPGISPTTSHLGNLVGIMKRENIRLVLAAPYFDAKALRFVSEKGGARIVGLAHQVGARPGTDAYLAMIDFNVRTLAAALSETR